MKYLFLFVLVILSFFGIRKLTLPKNIMQVSIKNVDSHKIKFLKFAGADFIISKENLGVKDSLLFEVDINKINQREGSFYIFVVKENKGMLWLKNSIYFTKRGMYTHYEKRCG